MVYFMDDSGEFDAPIERIWKLNEAHGRDNQKIHPNTRNFRGEPFANGEGMIASWEDTSQGQPIKVKVKFTNAHPVGFYAEILEGPMGGSRFFNYYTPRGTRTGVTVVGDFKSTLIPESQLAHSVRAYLDQAFSEDSAYLKNMK